MADATAKILNCASLLAIIYVLNYLSLILLPRVLKEYEKRNNSRTSSHHKRKIHKWLFTFCQKKTSKSYIPTYKIILFIISLLTLSVELFGMSNGNVIALPCNEKEVLQSNDTNSLGYTNNSESLSHVALEYYIRQSDCSIIDAETLKELTDSELILLREGIFAFAGRDYSSRLYGSFFKEYDWYNPSIDYYAFEWEDLSECAQVNIDNITIEQLSRSD